MRCSISTWRTERIVFSASALTVSRLGLVFAAALLADSCSFSPMATVGLAAEQTAGPADAPSAGRIDRGELRPYAIRVSGKYYVRMGAFDDRAAAVDLAAELRRVTTEPLDVAEFGVGRSAVRIYRVVIGPVASRNGVIELVAALEAMGYGVTPAPPTAASDSEPTASPETSESPQRAVGPDLVEVLVDSVEEGTTATRPVTPRSRATRPPEREVATTGQEPSPERADPEANQKMALPATSSTHSTALTPSPPSTPSTMMRGTRTAFVVIRDFDGSTPPAPGESQHFPTRQRSGKAPPAEGAQRFVQVGAYSARSTADARASELRHQIDGDVRVTEVRLESGAPMYRVRIGPVADDSLIALVGALESLGYVFD